MRIGFDAKKAVGNLTGIGNYSRGVIHSLSRRFPQYRYLLFSPGRQRKEVSGRLQQSSNIRFCYPSFTFCSWLCEWWRIKGIVASLRREKVDLFHGLSNELPLGIKNSGIPSVVTIHDLIFLRYPDTYGFLSRKILEIKTRNACRQADKIIAISLQTRQDLMDFYHIPEEKIKVIYQGCDKMFYRSVGPDEIRAVCRKYRLPKRYLLSVGTFEKRKNQRSILQALALLEDDIPLVLVSKPTKYQCVLEAAIRHLGLRNRVHILNNVPNSDLPALYQGCSVFIYLSYFEGFGIPILEALVSKVPVIAASGSCLEEAGGEYTEYCHPFDYQKLAGLIEEILHNPYKASLMAEKGAEYARKFESQSIAEQLQILYLHVIHQKDGKS